MDYCPKCKAKLNIDEKASGKCFACGATFNSSLSENNLTGKSGDLTSKNTIAQALKVCGIIIMVVGTIVSFVVANAGSLDYEFSFSLFIVPEAASIISGLLFLGFSEIIQLLQDIKEELE